MALKRINKELSDLGTVSLQTPPPDPECLRFLLFFNPRIEMSELCLSFCFDEYMLTL